MAAIKSSSCALLAVLFLHSNNMQKRNVKKSKRRHLHQNPFCWKETKAKDNKWGRSRNLLNNLVLRGAQITWETVIKCRYSQIKITITTNCARYSQNGNLDGRRRWCLWLVIGNNERFIFRAPEFPVSPSTLANKMWIWNIAGCIISKVREFGRREAALHSEFFLENLL